MSDRTKDPVCNPDLRNTLLAAVEEQLSSPAAPEVQRELRRLMAEGTSETEAKEWISLILAFHFLRSQQTTAAFDYPAYIDELSRLPDIDYDKSL